MAYEMLAGPAALHGAHAPGAARRPRDPDPRAVSTLRPAVPAALETRCHALSREAPGRPVAAGRRTAAPARRRCHAERGHGADRVRHRRSRRAPRRPSASPTRCGWRCSSRLGALAVLAATWWLVQRLGLPDWVVLGGGVAPPGRASRSCCSRPGMSSGGCWQRRPGVTAAPDRALLGRLTTLRGALAGGGLAFGGLAVGHRGLHGAPDAGRGPLRHPGFRRGAQGTGPAGGRRLRQTATERLDPGRLDHRGVEDRPRRSRRRSACSKAGRSAPGAGADAEAGRHRADATVAQELAQREGAAAVVAGEIAPLGARLRPLGPAGSAGDGSTLLGVREIATGRGRLIAAVDGVSRKLREGIGESLRSIRSGDRWRR